MRHLVLAAVLLGCVYAAHLKHDFNIRLQETVYSNLPTKYTLGTGLPVKEATEAKRQGFSIDSRALREAIDTTMNEYADLVFTNLDNLMIKQGFDPAEMPDLHSEFDYHLIVDNHGLLDLSHGYLDDISTVHRGGNVFVQYSSDERHLEITVPITFNDLRFTYDYKTSIMGLFLSGGIEGKIDDVHVEVKLGFNADKLVATLDEFYIVHSGHIDFLFNGNVLLDWLFNLLSEIVTTLLKEVILLVVEGIVKDAVGNVLDAVNGQIAAILEPNSPPAAALVGQLLR